MIICSEVRGRGNSSLRVQQFNFSCHLHAAAYVGVSEIWGTLLWVPYNKDPTI